jgi:hypothetical protein
MYFAGENLSVPKEIAVQAILPEPVKRQVNFPAIPAGAVFTRPEVAHAGSDFKNYQY